MPRVPLAILLLALSSFASARAEGNAEDALRRVLLRLPDDGSRYAEVTLPLDAGGTSSFRVSDSGTLPRTLARRFPGLRSFRGADAHGRTVRLDLSPAGVRVSIRDGAQESLIRPGQLRLAAARPLQKTARMRRAVTARAPVAAGSPIRYDFRLAVAADSRYVAAFGGTVEGALGEIVHAVNRANEVFETDVGVHFTLAERNDRIVLATPATDPFRTSDPGPTAVALIERNIGRGNYDMGHALTTLFGGESEVGTSCSDDRSADFFATHKAAAWSGHPDPAGNPDTVGFMIHVLGRQLGAWPTANGCMRATLADRAVEPGSGSTVMGFAPTRCGGENQWLQPRSDLYFHATSIGQIQAWLASRGGRCAKKHVEPSPSPWIDPVPLSEEIVIPARTPFVLEAPVDAFTDDGRTTYAWEQMDTGPEQKGTLVDDGIGPLFRSYPPTLSGTRTFPRMAAVLGHEPAAPGEALPATSRWLNFRLTVRNRAGGHATVAGANARVRVVDTGRAFAVLPVDSVSHAMPGETMTMRWEVAATTSEPISCHFVTIDLSTDGGRTWPAVPLATDVPNTGEAAVPMPDVTTTQARLRVRCDWRPFFAVSPGDFTIGAPAR